jgi:hypothetical protein
MQLACVPPERVGEFWPLARRYVHAAMDRVGLQSARDVEFDVRTGHKLLWLVVEDDKVRGAIVTRLMNNGPERVLEITALGADVSAAKPRLSLIEKLEDFARAEGCAAVRITGRRGWARALRGYRTKAVILEREL